MLKRSRLNMPNMPLGPWGDSCCHFDRAQRQPVQNHLSPRTGVGRWGSSIQLQQSFKDQANLATPGLDHHELDRTLTARTPASRRATERSAMDGVVLAISLLDGDGSHRPTPRNNSDATQHWPQHANQTPPYQRQCDHCPFTVYASRLRHPKFITSLIVFVHQSEQKTNKFRP